MKEKNKLKENVKQIIIYFVDFVSFSLSYFFALWLRFDCKPLAFDSNYFTVLSKTIPIYIVLAYFVFYLLKLYRSIWRYASFNELKNLVIANMITAIIHVLLVRDMPVPYYVMGIIIQFLGTTAVRFGYRFLLLLLSAYRPNKNFVRVMLIGAGEAGELIMRDILKAKESKDRIVCILDDNENKWGKSMNGVQIVGGRYDIMANVKKYRIEKIILAIPSASAEDRRDIINICNETGCDLKTLPAFYQLVNGEATVQQVKDVEIEDLLGREPIRVNLDEVFSAIKGKKILVTGGGGSIGSELCRQIASHNPELLIIFDVYENNAYDIQQELKKKYPALNLVVLIGSVRDSRRIFQVFETYHPDIVYHAAAHKHVPLMEDSPCEAIKNNVIGTYKTAFAAMANGTKRFVLISTDKAVNPTNVMGASKRLCEMVIQTFDQMIKDGMSDKIPQLFTHTSDKHKEAIKVAKTEFVAVRFGNVLGSNGSVIPLFKKQIASGGPVTVTHPDIIRYFMTIPEAVSLVLQAGTYAHGGEIFVLDMGSPVKIADLARNLIKLSGYKPDVDIKIEYTGLRPGEKLYEEKLMAEEGLRKTANDLIHIGHPIDFDHNLFLSQLSEMMSTVYNNDEKNTIIKIKEMVLTYKPEGNT